LAICSNHQARDIAAKKAPFAAAEAGMSILDTWLSMMLTLVNKKELELSAVVHASSILPAKILGLKAGLQLKQLANLVVVKQDAEVHYYSESMLSEGKNSPVLGKALMGEVKLTLSAGREVYRA
jgi:dihydroorotase